jgi:hypothetical protein
LIKFSKIGAKVVDTIKFWDAFLSKKENFNLMKRIVGSSFPKNPETAEEALSYVSEKILIDNKKCLQDYDPSRNATAYFCFVIRRIIRDFRVQKWGRFRPPKSLLKQPNFLLVLVYKLLCWGKMPEEAVVEQLMDSGRDPELIKEAIWIIRDTYKNCENAKFQEIPIEDEDSGTERQDHNFIEVSQAVGENPEDMLLNKQLQYLVRFIFENDPTEIRENYTVSEKIKKLKKKLEYKFRATDKDRLFLRMVYQDGLKIPEAGHKLKWNKWRSYGKHRRLLTQLRILVKIEDFT